MRIPPGITREHVIEAMRRLRSDGIPPGAASTKYDVLDRTGSPLPPKAVIALAAEIATGRPLSRKAFSGGEETNARLRALKFDIVHKEAAAGPLRIEDLRPRMPCDRQHHGSGPRVD